MSRPQPEASLRFRLSDSLQTRFRTAALPVIIIVLALQRHIVSGLTPGADRG
jgi:hypothetical protein